MQVAIEFHQGGEIFIPNLKAVSIYHLAQLMAGSRPIQITNQRGGEKLHESLVTKEEAARLVSYETFNVINPELTTWPFRPWTSEIKRWVEDSSKADQYDDEELRAILQLS